MRIGQVMFCPGSLLSPDSVSWLWVLHCSSESGLFRLLQKALNYFLWSLSQSLTLVSKTQPGKLLLGSTHWPRRAHTATWRAQGTPPWFLAAVILQMDRNGCCAAARSQCHSSSSPGCEGCFLVAGRPGKCLGSQQCGGISLVCFIPICSSWLLPVKPSNSLISSLLQLYFWRAKISAVYPQVRSQGRTSDEWGARSGLVCGWLASVWRAFKVYFWAYILLHCLSRVAKESWGNVMARSKGQLLKNRISHW